MDCDKFSEKIDLYVHNELSQDERAELETHINECETCRAELEFARKICAALKNLPPIEMPPDFKDKLHEKIKAERKNKFYKMWQPYAALAACFVLAVVLRSGTGDMLDSLKAAEVTPEPTVKTEISDTVKPTEVPDGQFIEVETQDIQKPTENPIEQPKQTNKNIPDKNTRVSKKQDIKANTDTQSNTENSFSETAPSAAEPTAESANNEKNENIIAETSDEGIQVASQDDSREKKAAYSARSAFPENEYDTATGSALSGGGAVESAAHAPMALKAAVFGDDESTDRNYVMNVDGKGREVVDGFMPLNGITKSDEAYNMSRDKLKSLVDELESSGAEYELMFDADACGDAFGLIIGDI